MIYLEASQLVQQWTTQEEVDLQLAQIRDLMHWKSQVNELKEQQEVLKPEAARSYDLFSPEACLTESV